MFIKKWFVILLINCFFSTTLHAQENSLAIFKMGLSERRLYSYSTFPKGKVAKFLEDCSSNNKDYINRVRSVVLGYFDREEDKKFFQSQLKIFSSHKIRPKITILNDTITMSQDGIKVVMENFNHIDQSFFVNGSKVVLKGKNLKSSYESIVSIIRKSSVKTTFLSFLINDAHALATLVLIAFAAICVVLPTATLVMENNAFEKDFNAVLAECESADHTIPYEESRVYKLLKELGVDWDFSIENRRGQENCERFVRREIRNRRIKAPKSRKLLKFCEIASKLVKCVDNYKGGGLAIKDVGRDPVRAKTKPLQDEDGGKISTTSE